MPNISHLLDPDEVPDTTPQTPDLGRIRYTGGGGCAVYQSAENVAVSIENQVSQSVRAAGRSSAAPDRFPDMDFRVRWEANFAYINRGRVYFTQYSVSIDKFVPFSFVLPEITLPLTLVEGDEYASVWLSLPIDEALYNDRAILRVYPKPDSTAIYNQTYWSGFNYVQQLTTAARPQSLFAVATTDLVPTPTAPTDYMVQLANIGFLAGVRHTHFGSVFLPSGFDAELSRS